MTEKQGACLFCKGVARDRDKVGQTFHKDGVTVHQYCLVRAGLLAIGKAYRARGSCTVFVSSSASAVFCIGSVPARRGEGRDPRLPASRHPQRIQESL